MARVFALALPYVWVQGYPRSPLTFCPVDGHRWMGGGFAFHVVELIHLPVRLMASVCLEKLS